MSRFHRTLPLLLAIVALACSPGDSDSPGAEPAADPRAARVAGETEGLAATPEYNIGDVESAIQVTVQMEQNVANVRYTETETKKYELAVARMQLADPYPDSVPIRATAQPTRAFRAGDTVVGRLRVHKDTADEPLAQQIFAWDGENAARQERSIRPNIMDHLDLANEAVVVHAELDIFWLPGQPFNLVSPERAIEGMTPQAVKASNPLRIDIR